MVRLKTTFSTCIGRSHRSVNINIAYNIWIRLCCLKELKWALFFFPACSCSSKRDNELLLKLLGNLNMVLKDDSVNVVKKAILTLTQLYKVTLQVFVLSLGLKCFAQLVHHNISMSLAAPVATAHEEHL